MLYKFDLKKSQPYIASVSRNRDAGISVLLFDRLGEPMLDRSPLELLAAFALCFAAGMGAKTAMDAWAARVRKNAEADAKASVSKSA